MPNLMTSKCSFSSISTYRTGNGSVMIDTGGGAARQQSYCPHERPPEARG